MASSLLAFYFRIERNQCQCASYPRDVQVWKNETYKTAVYGSTVFHSGDQLGSEIAVSCDMCHPRAANTHPETFYQGAGL